MSEREKLMRRVMEHFNCSEDDALMLIGLVEYVDGVNR